ncbi:hypothetical protein [Melittangium boletus]|uniref:Uncharacterized protein n=1 Tax=Melittangium boletus DSM 14713 TaxID=1294270 RepID=A0A250INN5_9BACT|nr:hypothetical protein [Melittangium boletus]ATB32801.1 hypothetical protein MEBOL_006290 [Melittangium boletus DSM 14713]
MLLAVALGLFWREPDAPDDASGREARTAPPVASQLPPPTPTAPSAPPSRPPAQTPTEQPAPGSPDNTLAAEDPPQHPVDLVKLREELPDNLYWKLGAPTKDPKVLQQREEETRRWNALHGKVLSNTATEEEIHQYYEHRREVSEDFIQFASRVLEEYGPRLSEQERGLYELSIRMHNTRLEEMPREVDDALARKQRQDQLREAWRGGQERP